MLQDDIPDRIQRIKKKYGMSRQRFLNHKVEITSRMPSYDIPKKLSQLETPSKEWTVTTLRDARYVLMHTFAHLLIKQMSMSSGYSSSAIRERIYFGDDMSGVLLYTGSADKEGSLGGLVELGNIDQLIVLMKDAFQEALVCTNDPECLNNVPAGNNSNGAACHSCCMISETACENGNRMLDRGLIVPIDGRENQSYFKTLVEELCQLEV